MAAFLGLALAPALVACGDDAVQGSPSHDAPLPPDAGDAGGPIRTFDGGDGDAGPLDSDDDGLDDATETRIAHDYLPFISIHPSDGCPLAGALYRLRRHPLSPATRLHMTVVLMYQRDCGALGHSGDDEVFGLTIDPSRPAPAGILAVRAIAHQGTACQHVSDCGSCPGLSACTTAMKNGAPYPVVFASKDKHGNYMSLRECNGACFFTNTCELAPQSSNLPMQNAGEPTAPMTRDLTIEGFITSALGWTDLSLFHFDPWGNTNFGGAGNVTDDLGDPSFLTPACN